jgi:nicotinate-nucleotide adenylyltransferase
MRRRVGLLGGTFNPPHVGHMICAQEALLQLELDVVRLVPAAVPPHKQAPDDPGIEARVAMCRAAVAGAEGLEVSLVEVQRGGRSYTVDTLRALHEAAPEDQLTFIVGGDMAYSLPSWREPEAILALARLGVAERAEVRRLDIIDRLSALAGADQIAFFDMPRIDISSTLVRRRAAAGRPVRYLVPDAVADLIESRGLYRVGATA